MSNYLFIKFLKENQSHSLGGNKILIKEYLKNIYPYNDFEQEWEKAINNKQIVIIAIGGAFAKLIE